MKKIITLVLFTISFYSFGQFKGFKLLNNGHFGIGTDTPTHKLHVEYLGEGSIISKAIDNGRYGAANVIVDAASNYPGRFLFRENGINKGWLDYHNGKINIKNNINKALFTVLPSSGHVGIGTDSPTQRLTVKGVVRVEKDYNHYINLFVNGNNDGFLDLRGASSRNGMNFQINGGTKMVIKSNGDLTVNGSYYKYARLIADFVFEKDYDLITLKEQGDFIKKHKHLPKLYGTKKIKKDGGVYDVSLRLEQTVEELEKANLYLQELNNMMDLLKIQNKNLQDRIYKLENK